MCMHDVNRVETFHGKTWCPVCNPRQVAYFRGWQDAIEAVIKNKNEHWGGFTTEEQNDIRSLTPTISKP